jgi:hypothetical protein
MLAFDASVPLGLDLGVDLLVHVRHRARAHPGTPKRLRDVLVVSRIFRRFGWAERRPAPLGGDGSSHLLILQQLVDPAH